MTSMPASRSARAMTFPPRSCPSRPGLAIRTRIGLSLIGSWSEVYQRPPSGRRLRQAQDAVVPLSHGAAAVAVARREVDRAVGAVDDLPQPPVLPQEERLGPGDAARIGRGEAGAHQALPAGAGEEEGAPHAGGLRAGDEAGAGGGDRRRELEKRRDHPVARGLVMDERPAVVLSLLDDVDLVASAGAVEARWTVLGLELEARAGLPVETLRVAVAEREDRRAGEGV